MSDDTLLGKRVIAVGRFADGTLMELEVDSKAELYKIMGWITDAEDAN